MSIVYLDNVIEGLKDLASYDFQKVAWFENDLNLMSCFVENVEAVFLSSALDDAYEEGAVVFGIEADNALKELEKVCDALGYEWDGREKILLESDEMKIIREMAKKCLKLVRSYNPLESTVEVTNSGAPVHGISFPDRDNL